jgi:hypothetical protein
MKYSCQKLVKNPIKTHWEWWYTSATPALKRLRQEDHPNSRLVWAT